MFHSDYLLSDEAYADDQGTEAFSIDMSLWADTSVNESDFDVNWHLIPTERELKNMEANSDTGKLDDFVIRKERRTALRH